MPKHKTTMQIDDKLWKKFLGQVIKKHGTTYELSETNMTNKIGEDAGKIWKTLYSHGNCDISSIEKIKKSGGKTISIQDLVKNNPKGKDIRILG